MGRVTAAFGSAIKANSAKALLLAGLEFEEAAARRLLFCASKAKIS
jgi:hypothetical protein